MSPRCKSFSYVLKLCRGQNFLLLFQIWMHNDCKTFAKLFHNFTCNHFLTNKFCDGKTVSGLRVSSQQMARALGIDFCAVIWY